MIRFKEVVTKLTFRCETCKVRSAKNCLLGHGIFYREPVGSNCLFGYYTVFDCKDYCKTIEQAENKLKEW